MSEREALFPDFPKHVAISLDVWVKIVWAAKESEDWKLRTLIDQAVMGAHLRG